MPRHFGIALSISSTINHQQSPLHSIHNRAITMSEFPPSNLRPIVREVFELLKAKKETISVAETVCRHISLIVLAGLLTSQAAGGLISASLLSVSGASAVYKGGLTVSLSNSTILLPISTLQCKD